MKKNYMAPNTNIVEIKVDTLMQTNSVENLRSTEASSESTGMSRGRGGWDDED